MQKKVNSSASKQNAAKNIYVPHEMDSSMSGVTSPIILSVLSP